MELWLYVAVGCEVGVSALALLFYYLPLSFRYSKTELSIPQNIRDLKSENFAFFSLQDPTILKLEVPKLEDLKNPVFDCLTCHLVFKTQDSLQEHQTSSQHGKPLDSPKFAIKVGSPYDLPEDNVPGSGVYRLVLSSGQSIPKWAEDIRPIRIDVEGETLIYWLRYDGLKRIR